MQSKTHQKLTLKVKKRVAPPSSREDDLVREMPRPVSREYADDVSVLRSQKLTVGQIFR